MTGIVHVAGLPVTIQGRYLRQRCAWCGAVLVDHDLAAIAVPIGQDPTPGTWTVGALVERDGPVTSLVEGDDLPDNACALLDPAATA